MVIFEKISHSERDQGLGKAHASESKPYEAWGFTGQLVPSAAVWTKAFDGRGLAEWYELWFLKKIETMRKMVEFNHFIYNLTILLWIYSAKNMALLLSTSSSWTCLRVVSWDVADVGCDQWHVVYLKGWKWQRWKAQFIVFPLLVGMVFLHSCHMIVFWCRSDSVRLASWHTLFMNNFLTVCTHFLNPCCCCCVTCWRCSRTIYPLNDRLFGCHFQHALLSRDRLFTSQGVFGMCFHG